MRCVALLLAAFLVVECPVVAAKKKKKPESSPAFAYYLLTLSWAPDFCDQTKSKDPAECGVGRKIGFVVHGLWPQDENGRGPENCGGSPVSDAIVQSMLRYIPTESLIQHEWKTHGTCSGLEVSKYFAAVRQARDSINIPGQFQSMTGSQTLQPSEIESAFASANPSLPKAAFRTSCKANELQEVRICLSKDLSGRACTSSAGECNLSSITVLPPR
jgi:ribonuclease T2